MVIDRKSYIISLEDITGLGSQIAKFDNISGPRACNKSTRVVATKKLSVLFDEADQVIKKLDRFSMSGMVSCYQDERFLSSPN